MVFSVLKSDEWVFFPVVTESLAHNLIIQYIHELQYLASDSFVKTDWKHATAFMLALVLEQQLTLDFQRVVLPLLQVKQRSLTIVGDCLVSVVPGASLCVRMAQPLR